MILLLSPPPVTDKIATVTRLIADAVMPVKANVSALPLTIQALGGILISNRAAAGARRRKKGRRNSRLVKAASGHEAKIYHRAKRRERLNAAIVCVERSAAVAMHSIKDVSISLPTFIWTPPPQLAHQKQ